MTRRRRSGYAWSRRTRTVLISVCTLAAAFLVWLDREVVAPRWSGRAARGRQAFAADFARYGGGRFRVVQVIDGDTLHLAAADAADPVTKVRLLGIDAPELGGAGRAPMYFSREAAGFARRRALGQEVTVYLDEKAGSRDRYDRLLAYIGLPGGRFLNEELLLEGCAYADTRFRHGYYQKYRQLEAGARALRAGLWAGVRPEQMPPWRQRKQPGDANSD